MSDVRMFEYLDLETSSMCNRVCPTCIRNSHPDRDATASFFKPNYLPIYLIYEALDQCVDMGFEGNICLSHYNEPLMDNRLPTIATIAKSYRQFKSVFFNTNGDFLTEELASKLDGRVDKIIVSLYMEEPIKSQRKKWIEGLFSKTYIEVLTYTEHIPTHFSPKYDVKTLAEQHKDNPCSEAEIRVIINHRRQFLLCCDDVVGNFDLGTFPETGIAEYWFGEKHTNIVMNLRNAGGRNIHSYCSSCPRP